MTLQLKPGYKLREQAPEDHDNPAACSDVRRPDGGRVCEYYGCTGKLYVRSAPFKVWTLEGKGFASKDWQHFAHRAFTTFGWDSPWEVIP